MYIFPTLDSSLPQSEEFLSQSSVGIRTLAKNLNLTLFIFVVILENRHDNWCLLVVDADVRRPQRTLVC